MCNKQINRFESFLREEESCSESSMEFILADNCYILELAIRLFLRSFNPELESFGPIFRQLITTPPFLSPEFIKGTLASESDGYQLQLKIDPKIAILSSDLILSQYEKGTEIFEYFTRRIFVEGTLQRAKKKIVVLIRRIFRK